VSTPMSTPVHFRRQLADELLVHTDELPAAESTALRKPAPRHRRRIALTMAVAAAAVTAAIVVPVSGSDGGAQAAYAVTPHKDGTVTIQLFNSSGLPGLQESLRKLGIPAVALAPEKGCKDHTAYVDPEAIEKIVFSASNPLTHAGLRIRLSAIPHGDTLVIGVVYGTGDHAGVGAAGFHLARQVPSCLASYGSYALR
jgi:hypothetical protein